MKKMGDMLLRRDAFSEIVMGNTALVRAMVEAGTRVVTSYPGSPTPAIASASAKQFASFAMRTGRASARSRSCAKGRPLRQVEFELRCSPLTGEIEPGAPMPTIFRADAKGQEYSVNSAVRGTRITVSTRSERWVLRYGDEYVCVTAEAGIGQ